MPGPVAALDRVGCVQSDSGMFHGPINPNMEVMAVCSFCACILPLVPTWTERRYFWQLAAFIWLLGNAYRSCMRSRQRLDVVHPYTLFNKDNAFGVRDTFKSALQSAKEITREIVKQIRQCRGQDDRRHQA